MQNRFTTGPLQLKNVWMVEERSVLITPRGLKPGQK